MNPERLLAETMSSEHEMSLVEAMRRVGSTAEWANLSSWGQVEILRQLREQTWEAASALMRDMPCEQALLLLEELTDLTPLEKCPRTLFQCQIALGLFEEAETTLELLSYEDREEAAIRLAAVRRDASSPPANDGIRRRAAWRRQRRRARRKYRTTLGRGDPAEFEPGDLSGDTLSIVTGLPRSGTSLMMQMLHHGGLDVCVDSCARDASNPGGYFECSALRKFFLDPVLLESVGYRVVKLFCGPLEYLPVSHQYNIIFMLRPRDEVSLSQEKLLATHPEFRRAFEGTPMTIESQLHVRDRILEKLKEWPQVNLLTVEYPKLVADPLGQVDRLVDFLGRERLPHPENIADLVDSALYRNRVAGNPVSMKG